MALKLYGSDKKAVDTNTDRSSVPSFATKSDRVTRMAQINSFTTCTEQFENCANCHGDGESCESAEV